MASKKLIGFRMNPELVDFIEKYSKKVSINKIDIAEALFHHFKNLSDDEKKKIITKYLTRSLDK